MKVKLSIFYMIVFAIFAAAAQAGQIIVDMQYVTPDGTGKKIGTVTADQTSYGTLLTPKLSGLSPGMHGFHLHAIGSCGPREKDGRMVPGLAAGGHFDPQQTGAHKGPYGNGHLGDLPALYADTSGKADQTVLAPRIKLEDLKGLALVIHAGGDNYWYTPEALGGGGARIACGTIGK